MFGKQDGMKCASKGSKQERVGKGIMKEDCMHEVSEGKEQQRCATVKLWMKR